MRARSARSHVVAVLIVAALVGWGCASTPGSGDLPDIVTADEILTAGEVSAGEESDPDGSTPALDWRPCGDLECAEVTVPLDHADPTPGGPTLPLAVARQRATGERTGALVINPGGPGASGIEYLRFFAPAAPTRLQENFDLVSFDPRGVGRSGSIDCGWVIDEDEFDPVVASDDITARVGAAFERAQRDAQACLDTAGRLLPYVSTSATARDLDLVRAAMGDDTISYFGLSYGTLIGAVYAELFPDRVRAMVLDGADKITPSGDDILAQYLAFEAAFDTFAVECGRREQCPLGPGEAARLTREIDETLRTAALDAGGDRVLTRDELPVALLRSLYDQSSWTSLAAGLSLAGDGDGTVLQRLTDEYAQRRDDGTYTDIFESFTAITCADDPARPTIAEAIALTERAAAELDVFASVAPELGVGCTGWPTPIDPLPLIDGAGAAPILVVGTTGDPATPYEWAVQMADALESATLLTFEGVVHTAFDSSICVRNEVVDYLVDLELPTQTVCTN